MKSTAMPAARSMAADDGWAILAMGPGERDLAMDEYWRDSLERSRRRREARRRPRIMQRGGSRASLALAAVALGGTVVADATVGPQAATASVVASLDLARGSTGPAVRSLQNALGITVDGIFGPQTERTVKAFQREHGIPATGFVGPLTTKALGGRVSGAASPAPAGGAGTATGSGPRTVAAPRAAASGVGQAAAAAAMTKQGAPYRSASTGPSSFDCSGLTTWAFRQAGVALPRTSFAQFGVGSAVSRGQIQAGDLVFFSTAGPGASDVGIATSPTTAISATTHGVMVHEILTGYWGSHFVGARRV